MKEILSYMESLPQPGRLNTSLFFFFLTYEEIYSKELGYRIWDFARQFQKPKVRLLGKGRELNSQHSTSYFSDGI